MWKERPGVKTIFVGTKVMTQQGQAFARVPVLSYYYCLQVSKKHSPFHANHLTTDDPPITSPLLLVSTRLTIQASVPWELLELILINFLQLRARQAREAGR